MRNIVITGGAGFMTVLSLVMFQPSHSDEFPSPLKRPAFPVLDKTWIK